MTKQTILEGQRRWEKLQANFSTRRMTMRSLETIKGLKKLRSHSQPRQSLSLVQRAEVPEQERLNLEIACKILRKVNVPLPIKT